MPAPSQRQSSGLSGCGCPVASQVLATEVPSVSAAPAISSGTTVVGALFGRKTFSASTLGRATTVARSVGRASKEAQDVTAEPAEPMGFWAKAVASAKTRELEKKWGLVNPALPCGQCHMSGDVRTLAVKLKKGISGAKATGAVLTLGWSLLATGLSRKEQATQAHCGRCTRLGISDSCEVSVPSIPSSR